MPTLSPEQHFAHSFQADAQNVYQFFDTKLWGLVTTAQQAVESDFRNFIDTLEDDDEENAVHLGDTVWSQVAHLRRRLTLVSKDKALPIDRNDLVRMNYDPTNPYVRALRGYFGRWLDRKILTRMLGTAYTGKAGATSVNIYDVGESRVMNGDGTLATAGSDVANTTATVLTPKKCQTLGAVMDDAGVPDDGQRYLAIDSWQARQMAVDSAWTYEQRKVLTELQNGKMEYLAGFNFVILPSSYFAVTPTDTECFSTCAWHRSAVMAVSGSGSYAPQVEMGPRPDKKYAKQIFMLMHCDATRLQGPGVVKVALKKVTAIS
jgi:hypothetical protein